MTACASVLALPLDAGPADLRDASWTLLLDHIAAELAREYVRLMEAAAADEVGREVSLAGH